MIVVWILVAIGTFGVLGNLTRKDDPSTKRMEKCKELWPALEQSECMKKAMESK